MLRAAGALAILLASLSLGLNELRERRRHLESLRRLCSALSLLEAELGTNGNPLADVFRELRLRSEGEARRFFSLLSEAFVLLDKMSFPEIWREAALRCFPDLTSTETAELLHLGSVLGKYELSRQCAAVSRCAAFLQGECERLSERCRSESKLLFTLPVSLGVLLIILLL